jgi:hypothetical protein
LVSYWKHAEVIGDRRQGPLGDRRFRLVAAT